MKTYVQTFLGIFVLDFEIYSTVSRNSYVYVYHAANILFILYEMYSFLPCPSIIFITKSCPLTGPQESITLYLIYLVVLNRMQLCLARESFSAVDTSSQLEYLV